MTSTNGVRLGLRDFELAGVALPPDEKKRFRVAAEKLAALCAKFEENLTDATDAFFLDAGDESAFADMPADLLAAARADSPGGGLRFSLRDPSYLAVMRYCGSRELRRKMHYARATRAAELDGGKFNNAPLIADILRLRREQARRLGFADYAECAMQTRMAKSAAEVTAFLRDLAARARPAALREKEELAAFAAERLAIPDLQVWDVQYAAEKLRREKFAYREADLRPYFPQPKVVAGMFALARDLFGIALEAAEGSAWGGGAELFVVRNAQGEMIGRLFLDLNARAKKRGGAWMTDAVARFRGGGGLQLPLALINCNFAPGAPALLDLEDVVTLFHEFGHALHHLLTEVDDYAASGMNGVEWDAVELPSQFMENFAWERDAVAGLTAHVETGETMPRALFAKARAARDFMAGMRLCRQLEAAIFDLRLHTAAADSQSPAAVLKEARDIAGVMEAPAYDRMPCGFAHIFGGGYAAGYYSYLWAETLAADAFAMLKENPNRPAGQPDGGGLHKTLCGKFRREILAVGGSRAAMESFVAFRGRKPDIAPLLAHYGLADSPAAG